MTTCEMCRKEFPDQDLDFLGRCEPCFREYVERAQVRPLLFVSTHNRHNQKETRAYVERLERKRATPQGIDHNYVKRIYA